MFVQAEVPYIDNENFVEWWSFSNGNGFTIERICDCIYITGKSVSEEKAEKLRRKIDSYTPHSFLSILS